MKRGTEKQRAAFAAIAGMYALQIVCALLVTWMVPMSNAVQAGFSAAYLAGCIGLVLHAYIAYWPCADWVDRVYATMAAAGLIWVLLSNVYFLFTVMP